MQNLNRKDNQGNKKSPFRMSPYWIYGLILVVLLSLFLFNSQSGPTRDVSWNEFQTQAKRDAFSEITVNRSDNTLKAIVRPNMVDSIFVKKKSKGSTFNLGVNKSSKGPYIIMTNIPTVEAFSNFCDQNHIQAQINYETKKFDFWSILISVGPLVLIIFFWIYIFRRMGSGAGSGGGSVFNVGKSKAKLHDKNSVNVRFSDVAGLNEAKEEIVEIVEFLKNPQKFTDLGGKIPKGALLVGPPGTGKTLLAKAVAGEADVPFFSMSGSDFVEMFVGVGASRVRDLFKQAKEKSPSIVFIDEIDAVGRARGRGNSFSSNDERENTLNQLLTEMDGFGTNSGVIILAATNRADVLDKALLRAGRFDRQIYVDLPDLNDRQEIFKVHLRPLKKIDEDVDVELLARQTPGFSGADIANVCNEAALIAARRNSKTVAKQDFMNAVDRIVGGLEKKNSITTEEERRTIAIHEAGHATISWMIEYGNPLVKVTIVPRGRALGAAWYTPEERQIVPTQALLDQICGLLGGRAAEDLFLGRISTGAANDLERVTKLAYSIVAYYGMSDRIPNRNYYDMQNDGYQLTKPYSEETARLIDEEAGRIIQEQYQRAKDILLTYKEQHEQLAELLLEKEVILAENVEAIFGKRQWVSRTEEVLAFNQKRQKMKEQETEDKSKELEIPLGVQENSTEQAASDEANSEEKESN